MGRYSPIRRTARRIGFGRNPLRRRVDRLDALVRVLAVTLTSGLLIGAAVLGTTSYQRAVDHRTAELRERHLVTVVLLAESASASGSPYVTAYRQRTPVKARWTAPGGTVHTADVFVREAGQRGDRVAVWFDRSGAPVAEPATLGDLQAQAWAKSLAGVTLGGLVVFAVYSAMLAGLDRRRYAAWAAEWADVSERWRHRI